MLPRGNQLIDTLARTNNMWTVRRLSGPNHQVVRVVPLTMLGPSDSISQFQPAGADRVAVISNYNLYIIDLATPASLSLAIAQFDAITVLLQFDSIGGSTYRLETISNVSPNTWTLFQDNIAGTGSTIEIPLTIQPQRNQFFRVVRQP